MRNDCTASIEYFPTLPASNCAYVASQILCAENERLKADIKKLDTKEANISKEHASLVLINKKQAEELAQLRQVAAKPLKLANENQQIKKELLDLENEHTLLSQETQMLRDSSDREWFLNGAGVIIIGIILGLIIPRLRVRKKSSWSSL